jgi:hypothetical protein
MMSSLAGGFEAPASPSPDVLGSALLKEAKRELRHMKKKKKRSIQSAAGDGQGCGSVASLFLYASFLMGIIFGVVRNIYLMLACLQHLMKKIKMPPMFIFA